jgi:hypothetical protein
MDENHPHGVPEWKLGLRQDGSVLLSLRHAATPDDRGEWTYLALTPDQARLLATDLRDAAALSPPILGGPS